MKTRSAKNKGQRATKEVKDALLDAAPELAEDDINVVPAGVTGEDLWLSPKAREVYPFSFEVKNQEKLNIWAALKQAKEHGKTTGHKPVVCFKRNRTELYVALTLKDFLNVTSKNKDHDE